MSIGSGCGVWNAKLTLTDRVDVWDKCGMVKDCDLNAAENFNWAGAVRIDVGEPVVIPGE